MSDVPEIDGIRFYNMGMETSVRWAAIRDIDRMVAYFDIPKTTRQPACPWSSDMDRYFTGYKYEAPSFLQAFFGARPSFTWQYKRWLDRPIIEWADIARKLLAALSKEDDHV